MMTYDELQAELEELSSRLLSVSRQANRMATEREDGKVRERREGDMIELTRVRIKKVETLNAIKAKVTFKDPAWNGGQEFSIAVNRDVAKKFGARLGEDLSLWGDLEDEEEDQ